MTVDMPANIPVTQERWAVLKDVLNVLIMKEKTPAKVMLALNGMPDIRPIEKMLMTYAMAYKHVMSLPQMSGCKKAVPIKLGLS